MVGVAGSLFTFLLHTLRAEEVDPLWEGSPHDCRPCIQLIGDEVMCVCVWCVCGVCDVCGLHLVTPLCGSIP